MSNPFTDLQARLRTLILAHTYFAAVEDPPAPAATVLTEEIADIDYQVNEGLLQVGFGIAIKTARGDSGIDRGRDKQLDSREQIAIWCIHSPTADTTHDALDAMWAVIQAVHGKPLNGAPADPRGQETFQVISHEPEPNAPEGVNVQVVLVAVNTRLI